MSDELETLDPCDREVHLLAFPRHHYHPCAARFQVYLLDMMVESSAEHVG